MRAIGRGALVLVLTLAATGSHDPRAEDGPKPEPGEVDRILEAWQRKAATITSIEANFRFDATQLAGEDKKGVGRLILAGPNLALMERSSVDAQGGPAEIVDRTIWNGQSILQFDLTQRVVSRYAASEKWSSAPLSLRLPFLFRMTTEEAKRDHDWSVFREEPSRIIVQAIRKLGGRINPPYDRLLIELDPASFLPRRVDTFLNEPRSHQVYRATEIKLNAFDDLDGLKAPCLDAWTVSERDGWDLRLFLR